MSRKFNIIPHEMYKRLITAAENPQDKNPKHIMPMEGGVVEEEPLDNYLLRASKEKMNKLLSRRGISKAAKNALYRQQLYNYIRQRKAVSEKPIKVEVTNQPLEKPDSKLRVGRLPKVRLNTKRLKAGTRIILKPKKRRARIAVDEDDEEEEEEEENEIVGPLQFLESPTHDGEEFVTPPPPNSPPKHPQKKQPSAPRAGDARPQRHGSSRADQAQKLENTAKQLAAHMLANANTYGVNKDGKVIGDRTQVIRESNVLKSAESIVAAAMGKSFSVASPPGTKQLRSRYKTDERAKAIVDTALQNNQGGSGALGFQSGRKRKATSFTFKPTKWKRRAIV